MVKLEILLVMFWMNRYLIWYVMLGYVTLLCFEGICCHLVTLCYPLMFKLNQEGNWKLHSMLPWGTWARLSFAMASGGVFIVFLVYYCICGAFLCLWCIFYLQCIFCICGVFSYLLNLGILICDGLRGHPRGWRLCCRVFGQR